LAGFLLTGMLVAFPGAILPAWRFHVNSEFLAVGNFFLFMIVGMLASIKGASWLLKAGGIRFTLAFAAGLASAALFFLAAVPDAASEWWRYGGVLVLGLSAGLMSTTVFHAISPMYARDPAATLNLAGAYFGSGCFLMALLVAFTTNTYRTSSILVFLALVPCVMAVVFARSHFEAIPLPRQPTLRSAFLDFKSPGALLLSMLLFIQFGNEWSIAGWLALFLIQRLGISPGAALTLLALYWLALMIGRIAMQAILPRARHGILLLISSFSALLGCAILFYTNNLFGATSGILFIGCGFAAIYPLVAELIGWRFPYYHPGFFNGIFSFASTGGLLAPWTLGIYAHLWGIRAVMLVPVLGACAVFLLAVLIRIYVKLTRATLANGAAV
jgi:FHS family glucose/mannose:H+ symporter-like MFS transporter